MTEQQQKGVYLLIPEIYEYITLYAKGTFRCEQIKVLKWEIILNYSAGMMSLQESLQQRVKRRRRRDDRNRGWRKGHKPKKQGSL